MTWVNVTSYFQNNRLPPPQIFDQVSATVSVVKVVTFKILCKQKTAIVAQIINTNEALTDSLSQSDSGINAGCSLSLK